MSTLQLYGTSDCHLCEQALEMLENIAIHTDIKIEFIDICEHDVYFERYQFTIPVVENTFNKKTCAWPFDEKELLLLIQD
jgi:arsenate reductase-like glutaredoxin family protein